MIGESRVLIPSPNVKTYDMKPEMSAPEVGEAVRNGMDSEYDFIVVNFANGDHGWDIPGIMRQEEGSKCCDKRW